MYGRRHKSSGWGARAAHAVFGRTSTKRYGRRRGRR